ncbi:MAG: alpha/beta fold hydrolase [Acidimicrobiales bacterium]
MSDTPSDLSHLHVERHGRGPLVLCTHGGADTGDTWREQVGFLAGLGRTAVSWDLRGHGRSAAPLDPAYYSRELAVADIGALVDSAPGPAVLMGHSLGGYLSLAFACATPSGWPPWCWWPPGRVSVTRRPGRSGTRWPAPGSPRAAPRPRPWACSPSTTRG